MVTIETGGEVDWGLIVSLITGTVGTLGGVWLGWFLQTRTANRTFQSETRTAVALAYLDVTEARFKVDQLVNHQRAAPGRGSVNLTFPTFRQDARLLSHELTGDQMTQLAKTVYAAEDATVWYQRVAQATNVQPPRQDDIDSLKGWLVDLDACAADLQAVGARFGSTPTPRQ